MKHLDRIIGFIKSAGAVEESDSERDGFLSYHAESHAAGMGIAAGYTAAAFSEMSLLGLVYGAATEGRIKQDTSGKRRRILADCKQEPHYCLGGLVVGGLLGTGTRAVLGQPPAIGKAIEVLPV